MTIKRKRPGPLREGFVMPRQGKRTLVATVPGPDEVGLDPEMSDALTQYFHLLKGNREQVRMKISMIVLTAHSPGKRRMSATEAYLSMNPHLKRASATQAGCKMWREIKMEIGQEGMDAIDGVHVHRIRRILADASGATFVRQFIDRSGKIVSAPPLVDHSLRLRSAELMMKKMGIGKEDDRSQPLVVNLIQYNPPGTPPWPGGGRTGAVMPVTTVPYAGLPAASAVVDLGGPPNRDD